MDSVLIARFLQSYSCPLAGRIWAWPTDVVPPAKSKILPGKMVFNVSLLENSIFGPHVQESRSYRAMNFVYYEYLIFQLDTVTISLLLEGPLLENINSLRLGDCRRFRLAI
jgi:hypothetical protein